MDIEKEWVAEKIHNTLCYLYLGAQVAACAGLIYLTHLNYRGVNLSRLTAVLLIGHIILPAAASLLTAFFTAKPMLWGRQWFGTLLMWAYPALNAFEMVPAVELPYQVAVTFFGAAIGGMIQILRVRPRVEFSIGRN